MKETFGLVPQVFYDLIGRALPGAATLLAGLILLADRSPVHAMALLTGTQATITSAALVVAAWSLASYLLGALLGAIAFAVFKDDRRKRGLKDFLRGLGAVLGIFLTEDAECSRNLAAVQVKEPVGKEIDEHNLAFAYDFILLHNAGAGSRLAKLRAEIHMCRVLMLACVGLGAAYAIQRFDLAGTGNFWLTLVSLLAIGRAAYLLDVHLVVRARRLIANCWYILRQEELVAGKPSARAEG